MCPKDISPNLRLIDRVWAGRRVAVAFVTILLWADPGLGQVAGPGIEQTFAASLTAVPPEPWNASGSIYVPAYSSVSMSRGKVRADFSVTLSIHNASESRPLVIRRVAYFDGSGKMVESYLKTPVALKPFATIEAFVPNIDVRAGTGANFVVDWAAVGEIAEPVTEALMLGSFASGHYAFISQGRPIRVIGKD
ncbi:DUF3124 domain-containing protein [Rhodopseudomonas palustris]|uniref:DUF3124 domain-containing protein n=1 Tax=Rhodopseudomonas palustris TaxID=1076 RepID=UPI002ACD5D13|nr:DUF3124 domain-containing protein [Rhodopseudomonas palustris]WQH00065.1 DUF3124 domain-containing protein [Rhodopseudomonas palustris]